MENTISIEIPADVQNAVKTKFAEVEALLKPFTINIPDNERDSLLKVGEKTGPFVDKVEGYTSTAPEYVPNFMDLPEFLRDKAAFDTIFSIFTAAKPAMRMIDDLILLTGNDTFSAGLLYYKSVKAAADAGQAKAKPIYEDLAKRFPGRPRAAAAKAQPN
jgi:hypothetical protein